MVAKFPIVDPVAQYLARTFGFYTTEAGCYQQVCDDRPSAWPTPVTFLSEVSRRAALATHPDGGPQRRTHGRPGRGCRPTRRGVIDAAAQRATWWESPRLDELTWLRPLNNPAYMGVGDQYRNRGRSSPTCSPTPAAYAGGGEQIGPQLPGHIRRIMANRPTTLAHTDFGSTTSSSAGSAPVTIIDWQLTVRSSGALRRRLLHRREPHHRDAASTATRCRVGGIKGSSIAAAPGTRSTTRMPTSTTR